MTIWTIFGCGALCGIGVMVLIQTALEHWRRRPAPLVSDAASLRPRQLHPSEPNGRDSATSFTPREAFRKAQTTAHNALPGTRWPKPGPTGFAAQAPYKAGQRPTGAA